MFSILIMFLFIMKQNQNQQASCFNFVKYIAKKSKLHNTNTIRTKKIRTCIGFTQFE